MNFIIGILNNPPLIAAVSAWAIAQIIKVIRDFAKHKQINKALFTSSGGFPSSHSSCVVALALTIGNIDGFNSTTFAVAMIFAMVVMYDAAGVRRAAGQQASILNDLAEHLEQSGFRIDNKLKELLGHTPFEVVSGAILGIIVAIVFDIWWV